MASPVTSVERDRMFLLFTSRPPAPVAFNEEEYALITKVLLEDVGGFEERSEEHRRAFIHDMHMSRRSRQAYSGLFTHGEDAITDLLATFSNLSASERNTRLLAFLLAYNDVQLRAGVLRKLQRERDTEWLDALVLLDAFKGDDQHSLLLIEIWSSPEGRVHTRESIIQVLSKLRDTVVRVRAFDIMLHMPKDMNSVAYLDYAMTDWPCKEDAKFIVSVLELIDVPQEKYKFVCTVIHELCPSSNHTDHVIDNDTYNTVIVPIAKAMARPLQFNAIRVLIGIMDCCTPALRNAICRDFSPNEEEERILTTYMQTHNMQCVLLSRQNKVVAKRDAMRLTQKLEVACPDSKVTNKESPALACVICFENVRRVRFEPCGHFTCCNSCYSRISDPKACPTCRTSIKSAGACFM